MQTSSAAASTAMTPIEKQIAERCDTVGGITSGIFTLSLFLTILRPDPTLAVCLLGLYGAHVFSKGAIRSFWTFLLLTIVIDLLWLYEYSALKPLSFDLPQLWEQAQLMTRREQLAVSLTLINMAYKGIAVLVAVRLQNAFDERESELAAELAAWEHSPAPAASGPSGAQKRP